MRKLALTFAAAMLAVTTAAVAAESISGEVKKIDGGAGKITLPDSSRLMFMPQQPYLPLGTLHAAVTYPASARKFTTAQVKAALSRCGLEHLTDRLRVEERCRAVTQSSTTPPPRWLGAPTGAKPSSVVSLLCRTN